MAERLTTIIKFRVTDKDYQALKEVRGNDPMWLRSALRMAIAVHKRKMLKVD